MTQPSTGQVTASAASVYESFFVPALFAEWAPRLVQTAGLAPGMDVLDVACGTGVVAREAKKRALPGGSIVGLDCNPDMLAIAKSQAPELSWRLGQAENLPFASASFDAVFCQFGLMFFVEPALALGEMWRVLRPGGRLVVAVWDVLQRSPGYADMASLLQRLFGEEVANELHAPFRLGRQEDLRPLFDQAGISTLDLATVVGKARFPSLESWIHTDIRGWTLAERIDGRQYDELLRAAKTALLHHVQRDGQVVFDIAAHLICAHRI